jgi:AAA ATPase containing von Willebrand factor type A (vWA) domain
MFKLIISAALCLSSIYCSTILDNYIQSDAKWSNEYLGLSTTQTIGQDGSLLCSLAMSMKLRDINIYDLDADPYLLNGYLMNFDWDGSVENFPWDGLKPLGLKLDDVIMNEKDGSSFFSLVSSELNNQKVVLLELNTQPRTFVSLVSAKDGKFVVQNPQSGSEAILNVNEISNAYILGSVSQISKSQSRMLLDFIPFSDIPYNMVLDNEGLKYYGLRLDAEPRGSNGGRIAAALILVIVFSIAIIIVGIKKFEWTYTEEEAKKKKAAEEKKAPELPKSLEHDKPISYTSSTTAFTGLDKKQTGQQVVERTEKRNKYIDEEEKGTSPMEKSKKQQIIVNSAIKDSPTGTPVKVTGNDVKVLDDSATKSEKTPATKTIKDNNMTSPKDLYTPSNNPLTPNNNNKVESLPVYNFTTPKNQQSPSHISEKLSQYEKGSQQSGVSPSYSQNRLPSLSSPQNRDESRQTTKKNQPTHDISEEEDDIEKHYNNDVHDADQIEVQLDQDEEEHHEEEEEQQQQEEEHEQEESQHQEEQAEALQFDQNEEGEDDFEVHDAHEDHEEEGQGESNRHHEEKEEEEEGEEEEEDQ